MKATNSPRGQSPIIAESFHVGWRTYELRWVNCGKTNCHKCNTTTGSYASHGPYWYLCVPRKKKWFRIYIGKELDTTRHIASDGSIDWASVRAKRARSNDPVVRHNREVPGQIDALEGAPPPEPAPHA